MRNMLTFLITMMILMIVGSACSQTPSPTPTTIPKTTTSPGTSSISGTVIGPDGPIPDVWIGVGSLNDWQETITDSNGSYSISIESEDQLWFHVRPEISARLAQVNLYLGDAPERFTQDFQLVEGNLLSLELIGSDGSFTEEVGFELIPIKQQSPETETEAHWFTMD